ncbi:aldo/keto reductase, partial [Streptomyces sp. SID11233]|nr:aldo/keto reductase [Streptomyces sp. SID11233]
VSRPEHVEQALAARDVRLDDAATARFAAAR